MHLTHNLDSTVEFKGVAYELDLSFNNVLIIFDVLADEELSTIGALDTVLYLLIGEEAEELSLSLEDKVELTKKIFSIHIGNPNENVFLERDLQGNVMPNQEHETEEPQYSFEHDADYIFASFVQAYNIDLIEEQGKMHWKKFKSLMAALPEDTMFRRVVSIRTSELPTGKGTEKQREEMKKLKRIYELPSK